MKPTCTIALALALLPACDDPEANAGGFEQELRDGDDDTWSFRFVDAFDRGLILPYYALATYNGHTNAMQVWVQYDQCAAKVVARVDPDTGFTYLVDPGECDPDGELKVVGSVMCPNSASNPTAWRKTLHLEEPEPELVVCENVPG